MTTSSIPSTRTRQTVAALCLAGSVVAFRLLPIYGGADLALALANLAPLVGLALCGAMLLPAMTAVAATFGAFLVSDVALNLHYGEPVLNVSSLIMLSAFAAVFLGGRLLRNRRSLANALLGTVGGVALFYLVTNTASFFSLPGYPKSFAGWAQALSVGLPGFVPTWVLGLRMLAGNLVFASAFYLAARPATAPSPRGAPAAATA